MEPPIRSIDHVLDSAAGPVPGEHSMEIFEYLLAGLALASALLLGLIH